MKSKKKTHLICVAIILILLISFTVWGNKALETNTYTLTSEKIGHNFDSYRIAQISDLHNDEIGNNNEKLLAALSSANPDIIVITGDLIDSRTPDIDIAIDFVKKAIEIAPCYYANGNHESRVPEEYETLKARLKELSVTTLENKSTSISIGNEKIEVLGIIDPDFYKTYIDTTVDAVLKENISDEGNFTLLLSHRPELFDVYVKNNIDLVLSGHAHGGQFRLPLVGGLYAPHQGAFPEYDSGVFNKNNTTMVVSRGVGNSLFPFRFNNRPEIIIIELKAC